MTNVMTILHILDTLLPIINWMLKMSSGLEAMSRSHARSRISATIRWPGFVKTTITFISYIICSTIIIIVMIENDYKCSSTSGLPGSILRGDGFPLCFLPTRTPLTMIGSLQHLITGDLKCSKLCGIWKYCESQTSPMTLLFLVNIKLQLYISDRWNHTKVLLMQFDIFFAGIPGFL